jgi:hypothetical protein
MSYNESLSNNSNYPQMSQSEWDMAPWNEPVIPERDFNILCSQTLSKAVTITTDNYSPEYDEEDNHTYINTENINWEVEFYNNDYHTPQQLLQIFRGLLIRDLEAGIPFKSEQFTKDLIKECEDWNEDETEYIEN